MKTHARYRTNSARKRNGGKDNKKFKHIGPSWRDRWAPERIGEGIPANHQARAVNIEEYFPSLGALAGHHH